MWKRARMPIITISAAILIAISCFSPSLGAQPSGEQPLRKMIQTAQLKFERGVQMYEAGKLEKAHDLFEESHRILLKAEKLGEEELQPRIDRVFHIFYTKMEKVDPQAAQKLKSIREQIQDTYQDEPVYAGQIRHHIDYLLSDKRNFLENSFQRAFRYMPMIKRVFKDAGIPEDLAYMALIESGFRPDPTSHAGAKGLWQFIPSTARQYGLKVGGGVDERTDPVKSTRAAARYLIDLYEKFGNWPLAVAAYNCGQGRVGMALINNGASTYWELVEQDALPMETQRYVPSIIAVTLIARAPEEYGFKVRG